ncbi:MAG: extracellular solute-binding protein [Anaerobutyricum sp.]
MELPYALPSCTDARGIWYNKVFEKAGLLDENNEWQPKTWQDILDACAAIKEKCPDVVPFWCNSGMATGEALLPCRLMKMLLYGTGETAHDDDNKWITGSDQGSKFSLNFLQMTFILMDMDHPYLSY